ncbi:Diacylglycerol O-acyltransferase [Phytophthora megakarya]|uniref:Diacylglycerol O-acyltransferase n=1 Tax=Phytophthora megakarya TaxID=4795 RepID=A0A225WBQ1_9STRA|nr:Diacylglycerol O-acyltransferase [Phytophthora megakarya]
MLQLELVLRLGLEPKSALQSLLGLESLSRSRCRRVLSTKDGWNFYQSLITGARFVLFQIVSWSCFGAGAALQVVDLVSLVVVELELVVGAVAVAGSVFVVAEIGMMTSLLVFKKAGQSPKRSIDNLFNRRNSGRVNNSLIREGGRDYDPFVSIPCTPTGALGCLSSVDWPTSNGFLNALGFVFFAATTNLSPAGVAFYGMTVAGIEFIMVISRSIATHLYLKDSHNGLLKEVNRCHVTYVLPQIITACIPAVATYRHYIYDMDAFVPVLALTIVI